MVKKITKYLKFAVCCTLIMSLMAPSYAALSASDGSAFVTKAEFDSALADFNSRLTTFEAGINSKIDSQVTSYLDRNGIWNGKEQDFYLDSGYGIHFSFKDFPAANVKLIREWKSSGELSNAITYKVSAGGGNFVWANSDAVRDAIYVVDCRLPLQSTRKILLSDVTKSGLLMFNYAVRYDYNSEFDIEAHSSDCPTTWLYNWLSKRDSLKASGNSADSFQSFLSITNTGDDQSYKRCTWAGDLEGTYKDNVPGGVYADLQLHRRTPPNADIYTFSSKQTADYHANAPTGGTTYQAIGVSVSDALALGTAMVFVSKGDEISASWNMVAYGRYSTARIWGPCSQSLGGHVLCCVADCPRIY